MKKGKLKRFYIYFEYPNLGSDLIPEKGEMAFRTDWDTDWHTLTRLKGRSSQDLVEALEALVSEIKSGEIKGNI